MDSRPTTCNLHAKADFIMATARPVHETGRGNALFLSCRYRFLFLQLCLIVKMLLLPCRISFTPGCIFRTIHRLTQEVHSLISERFPSELSGKPRNIEMDSAKLSHSPIYGWYLVTHVAMMMEMKSFR